MNSLPRPSGEIGGENFQVVIASILLAWEEVL